MNSDVEVGDAIMFQFSNFKCAGCGKQFLSSGLASGSYGEFLLRSSKIAGEAFLDALGDATYQEVIDLIKADEQMANKKPNAIADVVRRTYGEIACDPDEQGNYLRIGEFPKCPTCGSQKMESWEALDPPQMVEKSLPHVTHKVWNGLSSVEKQDVVSRVLKQV